MADTDLVTRDEARRIAEAVSRHHGEAERQNYLEIERWADKVKQQLDTFLGVLGSLQIDVNSFSDVSNLEIQGGDHITVSGIELAAGSVRLTITGDGDAESIWGHALQEPTSGEDGYLYVYDDAGDAFDLIDPATIGVTDHGGLTGLADDDHTQYLLVDGTRAMTGDLDMGTNAIQNAEGIEFPQVAANPGGTPAQTLYVDDGSNYLAGTLVWGEQLVVDGETSIGDPGNEQGAIQFLDASFDAILKVNDFGAGRDAIAIFHRHSTTAAEGANIALTRSHSADSSHTVVSNNDTLATVYFAGWDGDASYQPAASITVEVDGTPGDADMPGRMIFATTPDGSNTLTDAWRIDNAGNLTGLISGGGTIFGGDASAEDLFLEANDQAAGTPGQVILRASPEGLLVNDEAFTITNASPSLAYGLRIGGGATWTFGDDTGPFYLLNSAQAVSFDPDIIFTQPSNIFASAILFNNLATLTNDSGAVANIGRVAVLADVPTVTADTQSITFTQHLSVVVQPTYQVANGGTLGVTTAYGYTYRPTVGSGVTVTTMEAVRINPAVTGTVTTAVGIDIQALGGTTSITLRSAVSGAQMRHLGPGVFGANAAPTNASVGLEVQSTTRAFLASRMTTTQRNALTAADGMIIYNTTTGAFNFREGGAWVTGSGLT